MLLPFGTLSAATIYNPSLIPNSNLINVSMILGRDYYIDPLTYNCIKYKRGRSKKSITYSSCYHFVKYKSSTLLYFIPSNSLMWW